MVDETKRRGSAKEVRDAVLPLLATNSVTAKDPRDTVPSEVAKLPFFTEPGHEISVWEVRDQQGQRSGLAFVTGSGFGHWGVVVCPFPSGETAARRLHGKIVPWADGVFFFKER